MRQSVDKIVAHLSLPETTIHVGYATIPHIRTATIPPLFPKTIYTEWATYKDGLYIRKPGMLGQPLFILYKMLRFVTICHYFLGLKCDHLWPFCSSESYHLLLFHRPKNLTFLNQTSSLRPDASHFLMTEPVGRRQQSDKGKPDQVRQQDGQGEPVPNRQQNMWGDPEKDEPS